MLGDSQEDVGFDTSQKPDVMRTIARRAVLSFPWLRDLQIVRAWAALRVMPPDGLPIYDQSERFPGAFTANCHSGVTLAAAHANAFAPMVAAGRARSHPRPLFGEAFRCSGGGLTPIRRRSPSPSRDARARCRPAPRQRRRCSSPGFAASARPRSRAASAAPYCMMGVCFDCLAEIDGVPNRQSCMVEARPGMRIRRQIRARGNRSAACGDQELAIIGAGPAGMAAAALAAELGLETALLDEQAAPGGQIYRGIERSRPNSPLGSDYLAGRDLAAALRASRVEYRPGTTLWHIDPDGTLYLESNGRSETLTASRILLATGALRTAGADPGMDAARRHDCRRRADPAEVGRPRPGRPRRVGRAGTASLPRRGAARPRRRAADRAARNDATWRITARPRGSSRAFWPGRRMLAKGLGLILAVRRAGIPIRRGVRGLRAIGRRSLERVAWDGGELAADHLFLHEGVIPNVQVSLALQLRHEWDEASCAGGRRSTHGGRRACRTSPSPVMAAASPEPRRRHCRGGSPRSTRRPGSVRSTQPNATAAPRRSGRRSIASGRCGRFSTGSTAPRLRSSSRPRTKSSPAAARRCRSAGSAAPRGSARKVRTSSRPSPAAAWDPARAGSAARSSRRSSPTRSASRSPRSAPTARAPPTSRSPSAPSPISTRARANKGPPSPQPPGEGLTILA